MVRIPVDPVRVTPHGRYGSWRNTPADGGCGVGKHPCRHLGVDLAGAKGQEVYAPESGIILEVARGLERPWRGYNPGLAILAGRSGFIHLMAHLDEEVVARWGEAQLFGSAPKLYPIARPVSEGQLVGYIGVDHCHWEVRELGPKEKRPWGLRTNPAAWWAERAAGVVPSEEIESLFGEMSDPSASTVVDPGHDSGSGLGTLLALWVAFEAFGGRR